MKRIMRVVWLSSFAAFAGLSVTAAGHAALVAHWKLDDGSGEVARDSVGGNDGIFISEDDLVGFIDWTNDAPSTQSVALEFDGGYLETPFPGIGGQDPRTVTFWVKTLDDTRTYGMVGWGNPNNAGEKWHIRIDPSVGSVLRTEAQGGQNYATTFLPDGEWHHVASVFPDGGTHNSDVIHYVDGELDPQSGGNDVEINTALGDLDYDVTANYPVFIGAVLGHGDRHFIGSLADVRIYDEALTEEEIQAIMEGSDLGPRLEAGDANMDLEFNQLDLVQVQIAAKYLSGQPATWGEGDWDGAPGGQPGDPPAGDGLFNQLDIIAALGGGNYLTGPYWPALASANGTRGDQQTSVIYDAGTGEVAVDAPAGTELTSINIDSAAGIFTGDAAQNLGGSFDNDADGNIFKATFGSSFGSVSFGNVAQAGLSEEFVLGDLTVVGSLAGGGDLGSVDLIYVPEPASSVLLTLGVMLALGCLRRSR